MWHQRRGGGGGERGGKTGEEEEEGGEEEEEKANKRTFVRKCSFYNALPPLLTSSAEYHDNAFWEAERSFVSIRYLVLQRINIS